MQWREMNYLLRDGEIRTPSKLAREHTYAFHVERVSWTGGARGREGGGVYSFVARLSHLTIDHASLSRQSTASTIPNRDTSKFGRSVRFSFHYAVGGLEGSRLFARGRRASVVPDIYIYIYIYLDGTWHVEERCLGLAHERQCSSTSPLDIGVRRKLMGCVIREFWRCEASYTGWCAYVWLHFVREEIPSTDAASVSAGAMGGG